MTGAIEEHDTSYDKRAHGRVTATDTRLSNGSIISQKKNLYIFMSFLCLFGPHEDITHVDCILKAHLLEDFKYEN